MFGVPLTVLVAWPLTKQIIIHELLCTGIFANKGLHEADWGKKIKTHNLYPLTKITVPHCGLITLLGKC